MRIIPWILAVLSGLWFGWRAQKSRRLWPLWSLGGGLSALVLATIVFGLRHATCIPFSDVDRTMCQVVATAAAAVFIGGFDWLMALSLEDRGPTAIELSGPAAGERSVPKSNPPRQKGPA